MSEDARTLLALAKENPWHLFGCGELASLMCVTDGLMTAINKERDTPFIGKKARPEWICEWMQKHPGFAGK